MEPTIRFLKPDVDREFVIQPQPVTDLKLCIEQPKKRCFRQAILYGQGATYHNKKKNCGKVAYHARIIKKWAKHKPLVQDKLVTLSIDYYALDRVVKIFNRKKVCNALVLAKRAIRKSGAPRSKRRTG